MINGNKIVAFASPGNGVTKKSRQASLDIIRIIALIFVFMIHGVETVWGVSPDGLADSSTLTKIIVMVIYTLGRLSVPLFLFITGYLMLGRYYKKEDVLTFYKTKVWKLLKITWIWTVIYYLVSAFLLDREFSTVEFIKQLLFVSDWFSAPHMWYMPAIIGIYLFIPFVSNTLQKIDTRVLAILLCLAVFYLFVVPTANDIALAYGKAAITNKVELHYLGGFCGVMIVIGQLVRRGMTWLSKHVKTWMLVVSLIISIYLSVTMHYLLTAVLGNDYGPWYDSVFILIASVSLFIILLRALGWRASGSKLTVMATSVFGCYLSHYLFIYLIEHIALSIGVSEWVECIMITFGSMTLVILTVLIVRRISRNLSTRLGFIM